MEDVLWDGEVQRKEEVSSKEEVQQKEEISRKDKVSQKGGGIGAGRGGVVEEVAEGGDIGGWRIIAENVSEEKGKREEESRRKGDRKKGIVEK